ncbi:MAG: methylated-DNA--[protein]-cysteine S-methyltransferase [Candidatus Limnocylindrales bacterium]
MSEVVALMATLPSPWGPVHVIVTPLGVAAVEQDWSAAEVARRVGARLGGMVVAADGPSAGGLQVAIEAVAALAAGDEPPDVALDWRGISAWDRRVLEGARTLRRGEITSYGRLARRIGAHGAARAVGAALGRNPFWLFVPCHRVVAGDGTIGGYGGGPDALEVKRDLLAMEGVVLPVTRLVD